MTFTVTYRAKDGALREERIEAASRAECVAVCRKRGISPTGIREGSTGRDKRGTSRVGGAGDNKRTTARWVAAVVMVAAIAGGVWWWFGGRVATALPTEKPAKPKVVKPKKEKPPKVSRAEEAPVATNKPLAPVAKKVYPYYVTKPREELTRTEKILLSCFLATNQLERAYVQDRRLDDEKHPPLFTNTVHSVLGFFVEPSDIVLPAGHISDAMARQAFATPIEVTEKDTEEQAGRKMVVKAMLQELREYMDNGGHANEYFQKLEERQVSEAALITESRNIIDGLVAEGRIDEAKETQKKFDAYLKEKGLPPVKSSRLLRAEHEEWLKSKSKGENQ